MKWKLLITFWAVSLTWSSYKIWGVKQYEDAVDRYCQLAVNSPKTKLDSAYKAAQRLYPMGYFTLNQ